MGNSVQKVVPPPSSTYRNVVSTAFGFLLAIPLGIWVNLITADQFLGIRELLLSPKSIPLAIGLALFGGHLLLMRRWDVREREWTRITGITKAQHNLAIQRKLLSTYCQLLEQLLGCKVSARVFEAIEEDKELRLYQVRDVFIENEVFPQETAYTYIPVDHPNFFHAQSFRERAPVYVTLDADHVAGYPQRERTMVEPAQRWVLAAPIQELDASGRSRDELRPRGVIVFYGRSMPTALPGTDAGDRGKATSRDAAEAFVYMSLGTTQAPY